MLPLQDLSRRRVYFAELPLHVHIDLHCIFNNHDSEQCLPLRPFNIRRRTSASFRCINSSVRTWRASSHRSRRCLAGPLDGQNPTLTDLYQTSGLAFVPGKHLLRAISIPIWLVRKWDLNAPFRNPSMDMRLRSLPMRHSSRFLASLS